MLNCIAKLVGQTSTVASTVNLVQLTTVQFITLIIHIRPTKLTTYCNLRAVQSFVQSLGTKFAKEVPLFLEVAKFS